VFFHCYY